jgi:hypothetical protein
VLRLISQLYWSSIDLLQEVWGLWVKLWPTIHDICLFNFTRTCIPRVPYMSNCIFQMYLQLSNEKWLSLNWPRVLNAMGTRGLPPSSWHHLSPTRITSPSLPRRTPLSFPVPPPIHNLQPLVGATSPPCIGYAPIT